MVWRYLPILALLLTALWMSAHVHFVEGVRGVDQYWYLADTETLMRGDPPRTNTVFAGLLLRSDDAPYDSYFAHHGPLLYLNAWLGRLTGGFEAWKYSNLVMHLATALLIGVATARLTSVGFGWLAYLLMLSAPIAIWQAANLFQDTLNGFLSATLITITIFARRHTGLAVVAIPIFWFGALCHPAYTVLAIAFAILQWRRTTRRWQSLTLLIGLALLLPFKATLLPTSFQPHLSAIISSAVPGESNMQWHLREELVPITTSLMWAKFTTAVQHQFLVWQFAPLNYLTNAGIPALLWLLYAYRKRLPSWLVLCALLFGVHAGVAALMQNLPRYQLIMLPAAVLCLSVSVYRLQRYGLRPWMIAASATPVIICCIIVDYQALLHVRSTHRTENNAKIVLVGQLGDLSPDARVAFIDAAATGDYLPLITELAPRPALLADSDLMDEARMAEALDVFEADLLVTGDKVLGERLGWELLRTVSGYGFLSDQHLFTP